MDSPEALAISLRNDYITELHTVARKGIDDVLSEITVWLFDFDSQRWTVMFRAE